MSDRVRGQSGSGVVGRAVVVDWRGGSVRAWVPTPLSERDLRMSSATVRAAEQAVAALRLADAHLPSQWQPLARLLLRHEGVASSAIEGLREPIESILVAEQTGTGGVAGWVADNLAVMDLALETADKPLTVEILHGWHERLMRNGHLPSHMIGAYRSMLGWVGGSSPLDAAYIAAPPEEIPKLITDLIAFADDAQSDFDAVSRAAVVHAQFEAIHPYSDGNGRLGRVLVCRILRRYQTTTLSTVPISMAICRDPGGYLSGLHLFEQGHLDPWVKWFAETVMRAAVYTESLIGQVSDILEHWQELTSHLRADHTARALLTRLPERPILKAYDVSELLGVTERSGRTALATLSDLGILTPLDKTNTAYNGRSRRWFAATELLDLWG